MSIVVPPENEDVGTNTVLFVLSPTQTYPCGKDAENAFVTLNELDTATTPAIVPIPSLIV